jgi:hypothetical protein
MAVAMLALVVALGGSAYAVQKINGNTIAKRSIPGDRLQKHAVTSAELNLASFGKLFVQGRGHSYFGIASAPISPSACGSTVPTRRIVTVPGFGQVDGYCSDYNSGVPICFFQFRNTTVTAFSAVEDTVVGGESLGAATSFIRYKALEANGTLDAATNDPTQRVMWQIGVGGTARRLLTLIVTQGRPTSGATACHFQASAVVQGV